jgi:hypothetical protein
MRTFRIKGPFGIQLTLGTKVPGTLSISYPHACVEPLAKTANGATTSNGPFNEIHVDIPEVDDVSTPPYMFIGFALTLRHRQTTCRAPSPALTDIVPEEMSPEEIIEDIKGKGIKVRDFAYEATPGVKRIPELVDPDHLLGDHDYILSKLPRTTPIPGRTLRRLLDIGWIKEPEARARWHQMDWDALAVHDSRPAYPWRYKKKPFPTEEMRKSICQARGQYLEALEQAHRQEQALQQQELEYKQYREEQYRLQQLPLEQLQQQEQQARQHEAPVVMDVEMTPQEADPGPSTTRAGKRQLSTDSAAVADGATTNTNSSPDSKRRKLEDEASAPSPPLPQHLTPPLKQFPAPLKYYGADVQAYVTNTAPPSPPVPKWTSRAGPSTARTPPSSPLQGSGSTPPKDPTASAPAPTAPPLGRAKGLRRCPTIRKI